MKKFLIVKNIVDFEDDICIENVCDYNINGYCRIFNRYLQEINEDFEYVTVCKRCKECKESLFEDIK